MKNKLGIIAISALLLVLTACGSSAVASGNGAPGQADSGATANSQAGGRQGNGGPGGQLSGEQADLFEEVSSVSGNNITLKLIEMPSFNRDGAPSQGYQGNGGRRQGQSSGSGNNGGNNDTGNSASGNSRPANGSSGAARPSGERRQGNGQGQGRQWSTQYTGETKTITIPADAEISSMGRGANGGNGQQTLSIADIKAGNMLQVWYSDKEKETVSRVTVIQATPGAGAAGNSAGASDNASAGSNSK